MRDSFRTAAVRYGLAVSATALALAVQGLLRAFLEVKAPFLLFFPAVAVTAYAGGLKPGLVCALLSGLAATFFFREQRSGSLVPAVGDGVALILFLATCLIICRLIESLHGTSRRLERSQARARRLFESDVVGVIHRDLDSGLVTDANDVFLRTTGYDRDDLRHGRLCWKALTPPERARVDDRDAAELRARRRSPPAERELVRKDGTRVAVIVGGALFDDSDHECVAFVLDIRERIAAERATESAVRRKEETLAMLDALLAHAPVGFAFFDRGHCFVRVNDFLAAVDGRPSAAHAGAHVRDVVPAYARAVEPVLDRVFATGEPVQNLEVSGEAPAEPGVEHSWLTCFYPVRGDKGEVRWVGAVVLDVSDRKRLMAELRRRADELAEADRRKDEFLAVLSHELRNPLAPIRNAVELLRGGEAGRGRARDVIERQVAQLSRLVDDLLDVSRITRGKVTLRRERVSLSEVVARAVETVRPLIDARGHSLMVRVDAEPPRLDADPTRLEQVVANLLNNAAKYTGERGHITVRAGREGGEAVVRVRDTGAGIPADVLPHVFDLFRQADRTLDRSEGGLGIGLTLVKRLAELHGGRVEAHSDGPGRGSEFVVRLPLSAGPAPPAPPPAPRPAPAARRVLVVDDNADAADTLAALLHGRGHAVRVARDGDAALLAAREFGPEVVLLDIGLPGMDGYAVARALRAAPGGGGLRLVALTGYGRDEDRRRSSEAGFDEHLVKPVAPEVLLGCLASGK